jgi:hypothetical protein
VSAYEFSILTLRLVTLEVIPMKIQCFKSQFVDIERPRSTGGDLGNGVCGYGVYHLDELQC